MLDFGAEVALVAAADRLVPQSDADVLRGLEAAFAARGMNVLTATRSEGIEAMDGRLSVAYQRGGERGSLETDAVFLAVGWRTWC